MILLAQPTRTSCGPTCVAMLVGVSVEDVLRRVSETRRGKRRGWLLHDTTLAELLRLLRCYGLTVLREHQHPQTACVHVVRIGLHGHHWHWALWEGGVIYDPLISHPCIVSDYDVQMVFYEVTNV